MSTQNSFSSWADLMGLSKYFRRNFFITVVVLEIIALIYLSREIKIKDKELLECHGKILEQAQIKHSEVLAIKTEQLAEIKVVVNENKKLQEDLRTLSKEITKLETTLKFLKHESRNN